MRPLDGIRVADFTNHAAGPQGTLFLALLGAEVIRIESRRRLDIQRRPHPVYGRDEVPPFDHLAAHKRSVTLDLKHPDGRGLALEIVARSDVVVENFRPGVMDRLGLGWKDCRDVAPGLIMLSLSTNGQAGPEAQRPGYAPIFAAAGALGWITGYRGGPPVEIRNMMDHTAGLYACFAIMTALEARERTGRGRYIDLAAREVAVSLAGESIVHTLRGGRVERLGNEHEHWAPHGIFRCRGDDRWIAIVCRSDEEWTTLAEIVSEPWARSGEYREAAARVAARDRLEAELGRWTATQDRDRLALRLQRAGLVAERSMDARDLLDDEHLRARGTIALLSDPRRGERRTVGSPWRMGRAETEVTRWSPDLGEDNEAVICDLLGHTPDQLDGWVKGQVVY